jgi:hypothetical protein
VLFTWKARDEGEEGDDFGAWKLDTVNDAWIVRNVERKAGKKEGRQVWKESQ